MKAVRLLYSHLLIIACLQTTWAETARVAAVDWSRVSLAQFTDEELRTAPGTRPLPEYLSYVAEVANGIVTSGPEAGWIGLRVWRSAEEFGYRDPRCMEAVLGLIFFYTANRPWNVYYGDAALRGRIELALRFQMAQVGPAGLMNAHPATQPIGERLATSMFFTKFMGEALVLLRGGPPIDQTLYRALLGMQRRVLHYIFNSDLAAVQGRQYSNQYSNVFGGAYAYLRINDDPELEMLLERSIRTVVPTLQSPAGFPYEQHSVDFNYTLHTHHANILAAWHHGAAAGRDLTWLRLHAERWTDWLSANALPDSDGSYFHLNRAIESRKDRPGFHRIEAAFARYVPQLRAFVASAEEVRRADAANRARLARRWPDFGRLRASNDAFSPYGFLHRQHSPWYPSEEELAAARLALPCFASQSQTQQRVDDRRRLEVTSIHRSGYHAVFNAGESTAGSQTFGLSLFWHPAAGTAVQSQSRLPDGAWGVRLGAEKRVVESEGLEVRYLLDGRPIRPEAGVRELGEGVLEIHYRIGRDEKFLRFEEDRILVVVNPGGNGKFTEQIPVLLEPGTQPVITGHSVRISRGRRHFVIVPEGQTDLSWSPTSREIAERTVATVRVEGLRRMCYSLRFE